MSTRTKFAAVAIAAVTLAGSMVAVTGSAEAKKWHHGYGWGGVGLAAGLIGAGIASNAYASNYYYAGPPRCRWVRQFDDWGRYVGKAKVCNY
jgi:hypothetical protein